MTRAMWGFVAGMVIGSGVAIATMASLQHDAMVEHLEDWKKLDARIKRVDDGYHEKILPLENENEALKKKVMALTALWKHADDELNKREDEIIKRLVQSEAVQRGPVRRILIPPPMPYAK